MNTPPVSSGPIWECVSSVKGLLRHLPSGRYYSRLQINGRRQFVALRTSTFSVAKLRQQDHLLQAEQRRQMAQRLNDGEGLIGDLLDRLKQDYEANRDFSKSTKNNLKITISRMLRCWRSCFDRDLRMAKPEAITETDVRRFANYLHTEAKWRRHANEEIHKGYGAVAVNKTIELLHRILRIAVHNGGLIKVPFDLDPVEGIPIRKTEKRPKLRLPSGEKMQEVFAQMRLLSENLPDVEPKFVSYLVSRSRESAEFAEFMAFSGARLNEAAAFTWQDERPHSVILRGTKTRSSEDREVPKITALQDLLKRMKERRRDEGRELFGRAFRVKQCREALATACRKVGIERLTHHSLRHFFATVCIESGVDIPTIGRWLGHADGGILAMQTYGHLRTEHSFAAAAKVRLSA